MIIISSDSSENGLWLVVEAEENEVIAEGKFDHTMLGKIRLDDTRIEKFGEQFKLFYEDVTLEGHPRVFDSQAMFMAYAISEHFENVPASQHGVMPCDFPAAMIDQMSEAVKQFDQTIEAKEHYGMLNIDVLKDGKVHSTFRAPTAHAYLDFIVSGKPRAKNFYYYAEKQFGPYGSEETGKYLEALNEKLRTAATAIGLEQAFAFYDKDNFNIVAGLNTGRVAHHKMPGCMLNFFTDNKIDLPFDLRVDGDTFSMQTQLGDVVPTHILATMQNLENWNMLKLVGLVR